MAVTGSLEMDVLIEVLDHGTKVWMTGNLPKLPAGGYSVSEDDGVYEIQRL